MITDEPIGMAVTTNNVPMQESDDVTATCTWNGFGLDPLSKVGNADDNLLHAIRRFLEGTQMIDGERLEGAERWRATVEKTGWMTPFVFMQLTIRTK